MSYTPLSPIPVEVNFNITVDADGVVNILGEEAPTVERVIVADVKLPVNALYDASTALIEFWEPENNVNDIHVSLANSGDDIAVDASNNPIDLTNAYKVCSKRLARGLQKVLCGKFDASGISPFEDYSDERQYTQRNFGRLTLANIAHDVFGHVDATMAITNDKTYIKSMLSLSSTDYAGIDNPYDASGVRNRYLDWNKRSDVSDNNVENFTYLSSSSDANLALRLVEEIVIKKGFNNGIPAQGLSTTSVNDNVSTDLAYIVKQVIGQDASRATNVDGSQRTIEKRTPLRFYENDVIYVTIVAKAPTVNVGSGQRSRSGALADKTYALKITLGNNEEHLDNAL
jgi:hypothetical protein